MVSEKKEIEAALAGYNSLGKYASDRARMKAALEAAARVRAEDNAGVPVAWAYELANFYTEDRGYYDFELQISKVDPRKTWEIAPDRIRNIRPLYAHPAPQRSGPVGALADALRGLLKAYENAFDWTAELPPETAAAERIANEVLEALTSSKPEQAAPSGWQPIETAPKDMTEVLLFDPANDPPVFTGSWIDGWSATAAGRYEPPRDPFENDDKAPTHWMPLPAAPTAGGGDA